MHRAFQEEATSSRHGRGNENSVGGGQTEEGHSVPGDNRGQGTQPRRQVKTSWPVLQEQRGHTHGLVVWPSWAGCRKQSRVCDDSDMVQH